MGAARELHYGLIKLHASRFAPRGLSLALLLHSVEFDHHKRITLSPHKFRLCESPTSVDLNVQEVLNFIREIRQRALQRLPPFPHELVVFVVPHPGLPVVGGEEADGEGYAAGDDDSVAPAEPHESLEDAHVEEEEEEEEIKEEEGERRKMKKINGG